MTPQASNPLYIQGDLTLLLEVEHPQYAIARDLLAAFAELVKSPEHLHTYRITPLSLWNACSSGWNGDKVVEALNGLTKYPIPPHVERNIKDYASRYGRLEIYIEDNSYYLRADDPALAELIWQNEHIRLYILDRVDSLVFKFDGKHRGRLKLILVKEGYPAHDLAGYLKGDLLDFSLRSQTLNNESFNLRPYQYDAVERFHSSGDNSGGSGVIVLPCGAGKTVVGIGVINAVQSSTLILVTNTTAVRQWIDEILDKTNLDPSQIGEYTGQVKEICPITVSTYQIMTYRKSKYDTFKHMELFDKNNWGLVIYDEVHLLPAPVFQYTADIQARRRLGLTATLVREDGLEDEVFALIGPKKLDIPWKTMERQGWIAAAECTEIRVPMDPDYRMMLASQPPRRRHRVAAENPRKIPVAEALIAQHPNDQILIIGTYVDQLNAIAKQLKVPVITGKTNQRKRDKIFSDFRNGVESVLVVSKVANFAVDLPDASVAIQVSGTFGSRQEEAQRLGRLLRPKSNGNKANFYTLVTEDSDEQEFAMRRQLFLCEQGYSYNIIDAE